MDKVEGLRNNGNGFKWLIVFLGAVPLAILLLIQFAYVADNAIAGHGYFILAIYIGIPSIFVGAVALAYYWYEYRPTLSTIAILLAFLLSAFPLFRLQAYFNYGPNYAQKLTVKNLCNLPVAVIIKPVSGQVHRITVEKMGNSYHQLHFGASTTVEYFILVNGTEVQTGTFKRLRSVQTHERLANSKTHLSVKFTNECRQTVSLTQTK